MKSPKINFANERAVYDYFEAKEPNRLLMKNFHRIAGLLYKPQVDYIGNAHAALEDHMGSGKQIILAGNHVLWHDPLVLAAMAQQQRVFRPLITRVVIPGNAQLFEQPIVRSVITHGGAIPTFRKKDMKGSYSEFDRKDAGDKVVGIAAMKLNQGFHVAILPEGTRNPIEPEKVQIVREGIGRIACSAENPDNIAIVCAGIYYGAEKENIRNARVAISEPFPVDGYPREIVKNVADNLQNCVDHARMLS